LPFYLEKSIAFMNINIHSYGQGFPLVFFHGWAFNHRIWYPLISKLDMDYQLILVDLPGFGESSIMDWDLFKEQMIQQLPSSYALVGWSLGGLYATRLALELAERVEYLINVTSSPRFLKHELWPGLSAQVFRRFYQNLARDPFCTLKEFLELNGLTSANHLAEQFSSTNNLELGLQILENWDLRADLKQFTKPTCYMFGRLDPIVPIQTMEYMRQTYPSFHQVLFKRAGHLPFLTHMDLFIEELRGFIQ
jgi:pimeloyl-[acyl-carrier protein] methyl ester esterase